LGVGVEVEVGVGVAGRLAEVLPGPATTEQKQ
jgi:hypothetical protein